MKKDTDQKKAYVYALGAVFLWSTVATAFKLTLLHATPFQLLLFSSITSTAVLFFILLVLGKVRLLKILKGRDFFGAAALGLLNPFFYYLVLFEAYDRLPAQVAQPLNYTWAITLAFLSGPLLGQRLLRTDILGALLSYVGVVALSARGSFTEVRFADSVGVALALGSTLIWSLYWIGNTRDKKDPVVGLFLNFVFGTFYLFCMAFFVSSPLSVNGWGFLGAFYVGTFEMGVAFYLWLKAMKLAQSTARVSNLIFFSPFLSLVFIHFLLGEKIFLSTLLGLPLIVAGTFIQRRGARKKALENRS